MLRKDFLFRSFTNYPKINSSENNNSKIIFGKEIELFNYISGIRKG